MFTETLNRVTQGYMPHPPVKMIPSIDFSKKVIFCDSIIFSEPASFFRNRNQNWNSKEFRSLTMLNFTVFFLTIHSLHVRYLINLPNKCVFVRR